MVKSNILALGMVMHHTGSVNKQYCWRLQQKQEGQKGAYLSWVRYQEMLNRRRMTLPALSRSSRVSNRGTTL